MNRLNEKRAHIDLYARIQQAPMSDRERQVALNAVHHAESIVDGFLWVVNGVGGLVARIFKKPAGLKHSH